VTPRRWGFLVSTYHQILHPPPHSWLKQQQQPAMKKTVVVEEQVGLEAVGME
jgi:hypothetical protein